MKLLSQSRDRYLWLGCLLVLLYELPALIIGDGVRIRIEDNLESFVAFHAFLRWHPQYLFHDVPVMLGGLPWAAYSHQPSVITLIYLALPPLAAYFTNELLLRVIAFVTMYVLLCRLTPRSRGIHLLVSLCFAYLPYWMNGGASVAGLPALVWAALTLLEKDPEKPRQYTAYAILGLYPTYSLFAYSGLFVLMTGGLWFLLTVAKRRPGAIRLALGVGLMTAGYLVDNYALILNSLAGGPYEWHRVEFSSFKSYETVLRQAVYIFLKSHYHAEAMPYPWVWMIVLFGLGLIGVRAWQGRAKTVDQTASNPGSKALKQEVQARVAPKADAIIWILVSIFVISAFYLFYYESDMLKLRDRFPALKELNLTRFFFFLPFLWYLAADFAAVRIWDDKSLVRVVAPLLLLVQIGYLIPQAEWFDRDGTQRAKAPVRPDEEYPLAGHLRYLDPGAEPTYKQFVANALFDEAEKLIGRPRTEVEVACLGMYPSQVNLNDFMTVDGYWYLYPLKYKHRWAKVIAPELRRSDSLRFLFYRWGSRAYLFSSELGHDFLVPKHRNIHSIEELRINTNALAALGTDYVFSSVAIGNAEALEFTFLGHLSHPDAIMDLYVYQVPPFDPDRKDEDEDAESGLPPLPPREALLPGAVRVTPAPTPVDGATANVIPTPGAGGGS